MKLLLVHPSSLMYSEIFLRLEPLGVETVAEAARRAGHNVRLIDLQVFSHDDLRRELREFAPEAVGFGVNYLADVPEVIDLAKEIKSRTPTCFVFLVGHSVSFIVRHVLEQSDGAFDAVVRGERDLTRRRRRYFIGALDRCASIEVTRGCPWDCSFCSAWTFYGRSYRKLVRTQGVINRKHLSFAAARGTVGIMARHVMHGQTNFARMLWRFNKVYNAKRQYGDHLDSVAYELPLPEQRPVGRHELFIHDRNGGHRTADIEPPAEARVPTTG